MWQINLFLYKFDWFHCYFEYKNLLISDFFFRLYKALILLTTHLAINIIFFRKQLFFFFFGTSSHTYIQTKYCLVNNQTKYDSAYIMTFKNVSKALLAYFSCAPSMHYIKGDIYILSERKILIFFTEYFFIQFFIHFPSHYKLN